MSFDLNVFGGKSLDAYIKALDLFAGTGWGVACQRLGIKEAGVEIMPEAVATRTANGMETIYNDVWDGLKLTAEQHREAYGSYGLLIASPPCQTFSLAGKGAGRAALDEVLEAIELHAYKDADALLEFGKTHDPRTALVLTPLAYVWRDRPRLVAMEQVPTVLPVWEACAEVMREWGYEVKVDVLNAEQYGVPQTRKRAILVARRGGPVSLPTPTHSRYYSTNPTKLDPGVKKWVSMAEALGWGATDQPSHTVTAGVHGPTDRWASGGSSVRKQLDAKIGTEAWIDKPNQDVDARTTYAQRFDVADVAAIQTYPTALRSNYGTGGDASKRGERTANQPAPTLTSKADRNKWDGERNMSADEAGVLQTYARPFIWCGTKTKKFLQIGNAVPPLFAEHILAALLGIKVTA
jgi:DNA (cytosine-5)-methyltransferase 1